VLWVREKWAYMINSYDNKPMGYYHSTDEYSGKWKPSIYMPKEACRIFLKITEIRVERLQDISEQCAVKEGISNNETKYYDYLRKEFITESAYHSFFTLWESINGEGSWDANPWVWVIKFEQIEKPEDFK
jgi:hypothetical protein